MENMDKKTRQMRNALGYNDVEENDLSSEEFTSDSKVPAWVFGYSALALFIIGIVGMGVELSNDDFKILFLYFSLSFFLAPAILVYPVFRFFLGEGKTEISTILSALFGNYVQSSIKKRIDKWS